MAVFSYTAPMISAEEEIEERASLTAVESNKVRLDVFGGEEALKDTPTQLAKAIASLRSAVDQLQDDAKLPFMEARRRDSELVERETDWPGFLRSTRYNVEEAAARVVKHWATRKLVFGEEKAYLSMTLEGAMADDEELLKLGLVYPLHNDTHGRAVLFLDRTRCCGRVASREALLRVIFYMCHVSGSTEAIQKRGFVLLVNMRGYDLYQHFDRILTKQTLLVFDSLPITIKSAHFCTGSGKSVVSLVLPVLKHMYGRERRLRLSVHSGSDREVSTRLGDYGLNRDHARPAFGGSLYNMQGVDKLLMKQRDLESGQRSNHTIPNDRDTHTDDTMEGAKAIASQGRDC